MRAPPFTVMLVTLVTACQSASIPERSAKQTRAEPEVRSSAQPDKLALTAVLSDDKPVENWYDDQNRHAIGDRCDVTTARLVDGIDIRVSTKGVTGIRLHLVLKQEPDGSVSVLADADWHTDIKSLHGKAALSNGVVNVTSTSLTTVSPIFVKFAFACGLDDGRRYLVSGGISIK
jgi:hypothetical protein